MKIKMVEVKLTIKESNKILSKLEDCGFDVGYGAVRQWVTQGYRVGPKRIKLRAIKRFNKWYMQKTWVIRFIDTVCKEENDDDE